MRIVSLLPSATEIVADLGLGDALVGVSAECVHPAGAGLPVVTGARVATSVLGGAEIARVRSTPWTPSSWSRSSPT